MPSIMIMDRVIGHIKSGTFVVQIAARNSQPFFQTTFCKPGGLHITNWNTVHACSCKQRYTVYRPSNKTQKIRKVNVEVYRLLNVTFDPRLPFFFYCPWRFTLTVLQEDYVFPNGWFPRKASCKRTRVLLTYVFHYIRARYKQTFTICLYNATELRICGVLLGSNITIVVGCSFFFILLYSLKTDQAELYCGGIYSYIFCIHAIYCTFQFLDIHVKSVINIYICISR